MVVLKNKGANLWHPMSLRISATLILMAPVIGISKEL
jgi:hypothetical protein